MKLSIQELHTSLAAPALGRVRFLNEVASQYPYATSFASGSPSKSSYNVELFLGYIESFIQDVCQKTSVSRVDAYSLIGNYASAKGIISEHIAKMVRNDEGIDADPAAVIITGGAQEAISLTLHTLFRNDADVLMVVSPFYSGVEGAAKILKIDTVYVEETADGICLGNFLAQIYAVLASGRKPKAVYCTPNYSNPSGVCMTEDNRRVFLRICNDNNIIVIEDNTYGAIGWEERAASLKAMEHSENVVHIGSFSKSVFPGLRVGYAIAGQRVVFDGGEELLSDCMAKIKSMTTNNTSHICQAIIAGYLIENSFSIRPLLKEKISSYKENMLTLCKALKEKLNHIDGISWSVPGGGFFVIVTLPFDLGEADLHSCAREHGVIWLPIDFFKVDASSPRKIRLAYGNVSGKDIVAGVSRLAQFLDRYVEKMAYAS